VSPLKKNHNRLIKINQPFFCKKENNKYLCRTIVKQPFQKLPDNADKNRLLIRALISSLSGRHVTVVALLCFSSPICTCCFHNVKIKKPVTLRFKIIKTE
jgi:hypothetical protein